MLRELLHVIRSYRNLSKKSATAHEKWAWNSLNNKVSFRLDNIAKFSPLHGLKMVYRTLRAMLSPLPFIHCSDRSNARMVLECTTENPTVQIEYIAKHTGTKPGYNVVKTRLCGAFQKHPIAILVFGLYAIPIALRCIFSAEKRGIKALHITLIAEQAAMLHTVKKYGITHLYDFSPFLIDSNWSYILLKARGVNYTKIPSPGPLYTHNADLLADCLILSSGYHLEEIHHLTGIQATRYEYGLPESGYTYISNYVPVFPETRKKTLGFYSHGTWLRRKLGQAEDGLYVDQAEFQLLSDLSKFLRENPDFQLTVFLHPKERKAAYMADTQNFYNQFLEGLNYRFSEDAGGAVHQFHLVDIGVIALSTILFERLFCGYKTIIGSYGITNFPLPQSALEQITFDNFNQLKHLIFKMSEQSEQEFFDQAGMKKYRFDYYPYFSQKQPEELAELSKKVHDR
jgi:hypothetical protein